MPITNFLGISTTSTSNVDVNSISIQGTAPVSNFDNALRELMAILRSGLDGRMVLTTKSAGYTAVANDNNAIIRFSAAATLSLTAAATLGAGWHCWIMADGGAVVIDPNSTETINGATTITIPDGTSTLVICDGTNFRALEDYSLFSTKADAVQATVDVASATTTDIGAAASWNVRITGTTTITGLGTVAEGTLRFVRMAGALTLTHNATSLILPGLANITTTANDCFLARSLGSGNWIILFYQFASLNYEIGTFTPRIDGTSTAGTGTYTTQFGRYTKVGRKVFFEISLAWSAHTGTGNLICSGLPFTSHNSALGVLTPVSIVSSALSFSGQLCALVPANSTQVQIRSMSSGAVLGDVAMDTSASVFIAGEYTI